MKKVIVTKAQILHLLTMFVIVPLAGWVTTLVARYFPGLPHFSQAEVTAVFIAGTSSALGLAIHYLHGWQLWERTIGQLVDVEDKAVAPNKINV